MSYMQQQKKHVEEAVKGALAKHTVKQLHNDGDPGRLWKCSNNGSSVYAFTICAPPGWLIIYGDMGECMWSREYDMIAFAKQSIESDRYFAGKASKDCNITELRDELAREWIAEQPKDWSECSGEPWGDEQQEMLDEIEQALDRYGDVRDFQTACFESDLCSDSSAVPDCKAYTFNYLWQIEAIKWFLKKLDAGEVTKQKFEGY